VFYELRPRFYGALGHGSRLCILTLVCIKTSHPA
jgi:hypothetical protein